MKISIDFIIYDINLRIYLFSLPPSPTPLPRFVLGVRDKEDKVKVGGA